MNTRFLVLLVIALAVMMTMPLNLNYAAANGMVVITQCTPDQVVFNKYIYKENINGINNAVSLYRSAHPNATISELTGYMGKLYVWMKVIPEYAHCLLHTGIDPSSVVQLSPQAANVLINDVDDLRGFSADFLKEVPIPGFTNTAYFPTTPIPITRETPQVPNCQDKSFPSVNWSYCNFSGGNLSEAYLLEANLTDTNFAGANLTKAYAFDAVLKSANFNNSDLRHTELAGTDLSGASLVNANVAYGSLDFANLERANLRGANLIGTHGLFPVFYNATLAGVNFSNSDYVRADFENADLSGANFTNADLIGADFNGTNLTNANFNGAILTGANLHCVGNSICMH